MAILFIATGCESEKDYQGVFAGMGILPQVFGDCNGLDFGTLAG
jgi:hypothetical protein